MECDYLNGWIKNKTKRFYTQNGESQRYSWGMRNRNWYGVLKFIMKSDIKHSNVTPQHCLTKPRPRLELAMQHHWQASLWKVDVLVPVSFVVCFSLAEDPSVTHHPSYVLHLGHVCSPSASREVSEKGCRRHVCFAYIDDIWNSIMQS